MKMIIFIALGAIILVAGAVGVTVVVVKPSEEEQQAAIAAAVKEAEEKAGGADGEAGAEAEVIEAGAESASSVYHEFHPNFVVNIGDGEKSRFLAIDLAVSAKDQAAVDALKQHMPAVRNELILLFSSQEAMPLRNVDGKEVLRQQTLEALQKVMRKKYGHPAIQGAYFNKFVIQ